MGNIKREVLTSYAVVEPLFEVDIRWWLGRYCHSTLQGTGVTRKLPLSPIPCRSQAFLGLCIRIFLLLRTLLGNLAQHLIDPLGVLKRRIKVEVKIRHKA